MLYKITTFIDRVVQEKQNGAIRAKMILLRT